MNPPTIAELLAALYVDLQRAEARYKALTLDVLKSPALTTDAKAQVKALRTTLETVNFYADAWAESDTIDADTPLPIALTLEGRAYALHAAVDA